jgi:hypothetical protein
VNSNYFLLQLEPLEQRTLLAAVLATVPSQGGPILDSGTDIALAFNADRNEQTLVWPNLVIEGEGPGNSQNGSIQGQKSHDLDGDGERDPGEPGLDGWTIQLFDEQGQLMTSHMTASIDLDGNGQIDPESEKASIALRTSPPAPTPSLRLPRTASSRPTPAETCPLRPQ